MTDHLWSSWNGSALLPLVIPALLFVRGAAVVSITRAQWLAFWGSILLLVLALASPLDAWAEQLLSIHMIQHLLLLIGAPVLLVLARPLPALLWGLPTRVRQRFSAIQRRPAIRRGWALLTHPLVTWGLYAAVMWLWHAPALYNAAVQHFALHILEHALFLSAGLLYWWGVLDPRHALIGVLSVFASTLHSGILGALMTFAPNPWYSEHALRAQQLRIDPLQDQQIAGALMWVLGGAILAGAALLLLARGLNQLERRSIGREVHHA